MKNEIKSHFLSLKDNLRFSLFVGFAGLLLTLGMMNRNRSFSIWPDGNQIIDTKPKQSVTPIFHKELTQISQLNKA